MIDNLKNLNHSLSLRYKLFQIVCLLLGETDAWRSSVIFDEDLPSSREIIMEVSVAEVKKNIPEMT